MRYETVELSRVPTDGPDAARFSFSFEPEVGDLANSIKENGLIRPPLLRSGRDGLGIVCGLRRVLACKSLGWSEIGALVCEADELSDEKCLWASLLDNDAPSRLSPVERAIALTKFSDIGYDADRLASEVAPKLGLPPSRKYIEDYLGLPSLEDGILRAVHGGSFGLDQAKCLLKLEDEERLPAFRVLLSCRANLNETRELLSLIPDAAAMKGLSVTEYIESELRPIVDDQSLVPRKRLERVRERLRRTRYPRLTEAEAEFQTALDSFPPDERYRIAGPRYFEGDEIGVSIKARNAEDMDSIFEKLSSAEARNTFRKLFSILQGRDPS